MQPMDEQFSGELSQLKDLLEPLFGSHASEHLEIHLKIAFHSLAKSYLKSALTAHAHERWGFDPKNELNASLGSNPFTTLSDVQMQLDSFFDMIHDGQIQCGAQRKSAKASFIDGANMVRHNF